MGAAHITLGGVYCVYPNAEMLSFFASKGIRLGFRLVGGRDSGFGHVLLLKDDLDDLINRDDLTLVISDGQQSISINNLLITQVSASNPIASTNQLYLAQLADQRYLARKHETRLSVDPFPPHEQFDQTGRKTTWSDALKEYWDNSNLNYPWASISRTEAKFPSILLRDVVTSTTNSDWNILNDVLELSSHQVYKEHTNSAYFSIKRNGYISTTNQDLFDEHVGRLVSKKFDHQNIAPSLPEKLRVKYRQMNGTFWNDPIVCEETYSGSEEFKSGMYRDLNVYNVYDPDHSRASKYLIELTILACILSELYYESFSQLNRKDSIYFGLIPFEPDSSCHSIEFFHGIVGDQSGMFTEIKSLNMAEYQFPEFDREIEVFMTTFATSSTSTSTSIRRSVDTGCQGVCQAQWNNTTKVWSFTADGCAEVATSSTSSTTTHDPMFDDCYTTHSSTSSTTTIPCKCLCPEFYGTVHNQLTTTYCDNDLPGSDPPICSTTTCDCNTTTTSPYKSPCQSRPGCDWTYWRAGTCDSSLMDWYLTNYQCGGGVNNYEPESCPFNYNLCCKDQNLLQDLLDQSFCLACSCDEPSSEGLDETDCGLTASTNCEWNCTGKKCCSGTCEWLYIPETENPWTGLEPGWHVTCNNCQTPCDTSANGINVDWDCNCQGPPSVYNPDPCQIYYTQCQGTDNCDKNCEHCYTTTTTPPYTCSHCIRGSSNGEFWDLILVDECDYPCYCAISPRDPIGAGDSIFVGCRFAPTTTSTSTSSTTSSTTTAGTGACCNCPIDYCSVKTEDECDSCNGTWLGAGTDCDECFRGCTGSCVFGCEGGVYVFNGDSCESGSLIPCDCRDYDSIIGTPCTDPAQYPCKQPSTTTSTSSTSTTTTGVATTTTTTTTTTSSTSTTTTNVAPG